MRKSLAAGVFTIAVLSVACSGAGNSNAIPTINQPSKPGPVGAAKTQASVTLNIPAASAQSRAHKPFILSPNTLSVVITVVPVGITATAADWQVFPVTTPTPCAVAVGGAKTCTFDVQVPFGNDAITVTTYGVTNPSPSSAPLASASGTLTISRTSNGATPPPLNVTLDASVSKVAVTVPSPEPSNTPNTQVFTVGAAQSPLPLGVTAYDASGAAILSAGFSTPITLNVTPANDGVSLAINGTCTGSSGGGNSVSIGCSADLANVTLSYDGSITPDASDHITDTFAITATQVASPAPSPAHVVLQSNVFTYHPNEGANSYSRIYLQSLPNNMIAYMMGVGAPASTAGTFNVGTGTFSAPVSLNAQQPNGFYAMSDGSTWVTDTLTDTVLCFNAGGGAAVKTISLLPSEYPAGITFDGTRLWWGTNLYIPSTQNYAYSAPVTSTCTIGATTTYTLPTSYGESVMFFSSLPGGGMAIDGGGVGEFYTISSSGIVSLLSPGFAPGNGFGGGVATDATGKTYAAFNNTTQAYISTLPSGGSTLTQLLVTPFVRAGSLAAFGPNNTAADRIAYADTSIGTLDVIEGPNAATPLTVPVTLGYASINAGNTTAITTLGAAFQAYYDNTAVAPAIGRALLTTTWSVPVAALPPSDVLSIDERGDSGPFAVTVVGTPPTCFASIAPVMGTDHAFYIHTNYITGACPLTVQVTDKNGRSQTVNITAPEPIS